MALFVVSLLSMSQLGCNRPKNSEERRPGVSECLLFQVSVDVYVLLFYFIQVYRLMSSYECTIVYLGTVIA